jgi:hypothetical protein
MRTRGVAARRAEHFEVQLGARLDAAQFVDVEAFDARLQRRARGCSWACTGAGMVAVNSGSAATTAAASVCRVVAMMSSCEFGLSMWPAYAARPYSSVR